MLLIQKKIDLIIRRVLSSLKKFKNMNKTLIDQTTSTHKYVQNNPSWTWPTHPLPSFTGIFFFLIWQDPLDMTI